LFSIAGINGVDQFVSCVLLRVLEYVVLSSGSLQYKATQRTQYKDSIRRNHFPSPPELSQEKALAPPTGFERVLGGARLPPAAEAGEEDVTTAEAMPLSPSAVFASGPPPLRLMPSSKNRLRPSAGLAVDGAVDVPEKVREADLGLRTLIPVSLRW